MNKRTFLHAVFGSGLALSGQGAGAALIVQVNYAGFGTVDSSHRVYVVLWDTPEFVRDGAQVRPLEIESVSAKSDAVRFDNVRNNPVYVSAVYHPSETWDAKSSPLPGSSLGLYAKKRHTPEPIQLPAENATKISLTFADPSNAR